MGVIGSIISTYRKAILQNLQGSALGNTPFTPATALKNMGN